MNYDQLLELHTTLHHTLNFLKYHSDSPEELDNRVRKQIEVVWKQSCRPTIPNLKAFCFTYRRRQ